MILKMWLQLPLLLVSIAKEQRRTNTYLATAIEMQADTNRLLRRLYVKGRGITVYNQPAKEASDA